MTLQEGKGKKLYVVGNYRFTGKLLGKGNFARVEEAIHNILNVKVAIKIMDINNIKEEYVIKNLYREAKLMAKLNHPCICALYQTMQRSDNVYFLVTELAPGGDLCTFVKEQRGGRLEERPARIYARQFVSALSHMHQIGVVHRDLKMENVMLNSARTQIKIVDFGLSNSYRPDEPLRTHCGSPEYAAPELFITGLKYGSEVDLWSLGIILYGMVVGHLPFVCNHDDKLNSQERRKKLVAQINKGLGSSHKKSLSSFSLDFRNLIGRMLVADIAKRISIKDLLVHPFITEKGSKMLKTNPIRKLDLRHQAEIITELCELTRQTSDQVIRMVKQEPFSKIGGMYNILAHRLALSRLGGDGITKVQPALESDFRPKSPLESFANKPYHLRSNVAKPVSSRDDSCRTAVQDRKLLTQKDRKVPMSPRMPIRPMTQAGRPSTPKTRTRPQTVHANVGDKQIINNKDFKGPFGIKKGCSATITPKTNRPVTVASPITNKVSSAMISDIAKRLHLSGKLDKEVKRPSTNNKMTLAISNGGQVHSKAEKSAGADPISRAQTACEKKQRSRSEKLPNARPASTTPGATRKTLVTTHSDSKTTTKRPQTSPAKESRPLARLLKISRPSTSGQAAVKMAYGDIAQRNQALLQKTKKPTIYDPIARSIAEYVYNNVPDKLTKLSNLRK